MLPNAVGGAGVEPNAVDGAGFDPKVVEGAGIDPKVVVEDGDAPKPEEGAGAFEVEPNENPPPLDDGAGVGAAPKEKAIIKSVIQRES